MKENDFTSKKENALTSHMFSSDLPISKSNEDLLGRENFVGAFTTAIQSRQSKDSLILGLYGKWGEGKTSTKNLIIENLKNRSSHDIEVFEFNPWQWSHSQELTRIFIQEFSKFIGKSSIEKGEEILEKIIEYEPLLYSIAYSVEPASAKFISYIWGCIKKCIWKRNTKTLLEAKEEIKKLMRDQNQKILIVIDDIDRLRPQEIKDIFKFIKSNLDFPNIIFLTLFQKDIIEEALSEKNFSGERYLEKIVQVGISLPDISGDTIKNILIKRLELLLSKYYEPEDIDKDRWHTFFNHGVIFYFKNLRDINRFISSLEFQISALKVNGFMEANFIDIVGLEVLRQFETNVYQKLFKNKETLTLERFEGTEFSNDYYFNKNKEIIKEIIGISGIESTKSVKQIGIEPKTKREESIINIFKKMFPNTECFLSNTYYTVTNEDFIKKRICHKDRFDRYFLLSIQKEEFPQYEFENMLNATSDEKKLLDIFLKYKKENRLKEFLEKLEYYKQHISAETPIPFLSTMFYLGDIVDNKMRDFLDISPFDQLSRIIFWYLKKKEFKENSGEILLSTVDKTHGVFMPIHFLWKEYERREEKKYPDQYFFNKEDKNMIKSKILKLIEKKKEEFEENIHLSQIINIWKQLDEGLAKKWLSSFIEKDENFIKFLNMLISNGVEYIASQKIERFYVEKDWISKFFDDIDSMLERFNKLKNDNKIDNNNYPNLIQVMADLENKNKNN